MLLINETLERVAHLRRAGANEDKCVGRDWLYALPSLSNARGYIVTMFRFQSAIGAGRLSIGAVADRTEQTLLCLQSKAYGLESRGLPRIALRGYSAKQERSKRHSTIAGNENLVARHRRLHVFVLVRAAFRCRNGLHLDAIQNFEHYSIVLSYYSIV